MTTTHDADPTVRIGTSTAARTALTTLHSAIHGPRR